MVNKLYSEKVILSVAEAAEIAGMSTDVLLGRIHAGKLNAVKSGRCYLIWVVDFFPFVALERLGARLPNPKGPYSLSEVAEALQTDVATIEDLLDTNALISRPGLARYGNRPIPLKSLGRLIVRKYRSFAEILLDTYS